MMNMISIHYPNGDVVILHEDRLALVDIKNVIEIEAPDQDQKVKDIWANHFLTQVIAMSVDSEVKFKRVVIKKYEA